MRTASEKGSLATVPDALAALRSGRMVIVVDDADRENEGDFVMAAEHVTAQTINFMATVGRGLICVPMRTDVLDALEIPPAVAVNTDPKRTAFRVAVDHATLTTTGISASDRANTIRALVDPASRAGDFTRPGHVFPLGYTQGGVLARPGHTEAAVDLAELAGLTPAGVICEICSSDGEMARLPELLAIGRRYGLPVLTIADLIAHRRRQLGKVTRAGEARLPLPAGEFRAIGFVDGAGGDHVALVLGDLTDGAAPLISIHSECLLGDVFGSRREQLEYALSAIAEHGRGAVIYLRRVEGGGARDIAAGHAPDEHAHQVADAILSNLGARRFRLLSDDGTNTGRARSA